MMTQLPIEASPARPTAPLNTPPVPAGTPPDNERQPSAAPTTTPRPHSRATHGIVGPAVVVHALLALAFAPVHATYLVAVLGAITLASTFFLTCRASPDRAASRYTASLCLGGFAVLHAYQLHGAVAAWFFPYIALLLLVFYEDPRCLWPGVIVVSIAHIVAPLFGSGRFSVSGATVEPSAYFLELGLYLAGAITATVGSVLLQGRTRRAIERHRALAAENTRVTLELEQMRARLGDTTTRRKNPSGRTESPPEEQERDRRKRLALDAAPDAIAVIDAESGLIVDLNPKIAELTGRSLHELIGREHVILYPVAREMFIRTIFRHAAAGDQRMVELELIHRDGRTTAVEVALNLTHSSHERLVVAVFRDITERKRTEDRRALLSARHQEMLRLEGLHAMAAGIAHDFNNILMTILGFASIGRDRCGNQPVAQSYFDRIEGATLRAGEVCRQMLTFAGRGQVTLRSADLNETVRDLEPVLRARLSPLVELEFTTTANLPEVCFDPTSVAKAVGLLFTNALEAIGERSGAVHIRTFQVTSDDPIREESFISPELTRDTYAVIEIRDTGSGIAPSALPRVFEPFYSTKSIGRGLGLSEALGVIRAQHGAIQVKSTLGEGTTFRIYLPSAPCRRSASLVHRALPTASAGARPRNIALVIEDETSVRELVSSMVEELGFTVHCAVDGTEGLALVERYGPQVGLILLDLTMPGIPSQQVLAAIRQSRQEAQVLIMSGYSEQDVLARCGQSRPDGFLQKPFSLAALRGAILGKDNANALPGR